MFRALVVAIFREVFLEGYQQTQHHHLRLYGVTTYTAYQNAISTNNIINILCFNIDFKLVNKANLVHNVFLV